MLKREFKVRVIVSEVLGVILSDFFSLLKVSVQFGLAGNID